MDFISPAATIVLPPNLRFAPGVGAVMLGALCARLMFHWAVVAIPFLLGTEFLLSWAGIVSG
jgi:hypothetical protein